MTGTTIYPSDFVTRVKETFPDEPRLHELLDEGSYAVGQYLGGNGAGHVVAIQEVLKALDGSPAKLAKFREKITKKAQRATTIDKLYREWDKLCNPS